MLRANAQILSFLAQNSTKNKTFIFSNDNDNLPKEECAAMTATNGLTDKDAKNRKIVQKDNLKKCQQGNESKEGFLSLFSKKSQISPNSSDGKTSRTSNDSSK